MTGEAEIRAVLERITDPATGQALAAAGRIASVTVAGGAARVVLEIPPDRGPALVPLARRAEAEIARLPGIGRAAVILTAETAPRGDPPPALGPRPAERPAPRPVPGVERILAVGSGKGGVGKSTVAANLAVALAAEGRRAGLLDADVYGPSQHRMMGLTDRRPTSPDGQMIDPLRAHGVQLMSMGLLVPETQATVWRGPMLMKALQQLLFTVLWDRLDVLVVDLPPGTGDVPLTLAQRARVTGAVVVSTPQDIALIDARKAIDMFRRLEVPLAGIVENMSTFCCPACGHETPLFGHGGAEAEARRLGVPFLGAIPLELGTRLAGDAGTPVVAAEADGPQAARFRAIARALVSAGMG
ncbi:MAG: iron-sulfur cluster carrier protein [Paracoccaceae bacterium]|nr:MAG: iron-sulfur cluster carrier protein [Paracoccaceae bacterium]